MFFITRKLMTSFLGGLALSALLLLPKTVSAQVKVSPMVIMTETQQGQARGVITLTNQTNQEARLRLYSLPFTYSSQGFEVTEANPDDLSPFLIFNPKEVVLQPFQVRRVRIIARMLPSTPPGEYRAVIFAEPLREKTTTSGMSINSRVGVTIYVRHGDITFDLAVKEATFDPKAQNINLAVNNNGKATIRPGVRWSLSQNNQEVFKNEISEITIIGSGARNIPLSLKQPEQKVTLTNGEYQLKGEIVWPNGDKEATLPFSFPITISPPPVTPVTTTPSQK